MVDILPRDPEAGARNLLQDCLGLRAGERLLLIQEDPVHGYYDAAAPACVAQVAKDLGATLETYHAPLIDGPGDVPEDMLTALGRVDHAIFFARIGDQVRFTALPGQASKTMCYTLDIDFLGSPFGRIPHGLMVEVLRRVEEAIAGTSTWSMTCPLGTDLVGRVENFWGQDAAPTGFSLKLFPEMIFRPISCHSMSGQAAVAHWLMATGNRVYEPDRLDLEAPILARVEAGRVTGFEGPGAVVAKAEAHYHRVAALFDIDPWVVHSWHAGIQPKTYYPRPAGADFDRWGGLAFGSPRYAHFHTCGDYAPGEIAWSLFDVTIAFDDEVFWRDGRLVFLERPEIQALLADYPQWHEGFSEERDIGID